MRPSSLLFAFCKAKHGMAQGFGYQNSAARVLYFNLSNGTSALSLVQDQGNCRIYATAPGDRAFPGVLFQQILMANAALRPEGVPRARSGVLRRKWRGWRRRHE